MSVKRSCGCNYYKPEVKQNEILFKNGQAVFLDRDLRKKIWFVEQPRLSRDPAIGTLICRIKLQTRIDEDIPVDIQCRFVNKDGTIEKPVWQPKVLTRHEVHQMTFRSLSADAEKIQIYIRNSR